ncbi:MAG: hypothetical protein IT442_04635 [Phycisphaeraceae bacterium]|nr:hypothetical protein [Phycisphaeraceae bacterium]
MGRMMRLLSLLSVLAVFTAACSAAPPTRPGPRRLPDVQDSSLNESSGLAASSANPGLLWTHNDSGSARLYLVDLQGRVRGTYAPQATRQTRMHPPPARRGQSAVSNVDWEDIASFSREGRDYLLIGDIGDNGRARACVTLYLIEEPVLPPPPALPPRDAPAGVIARYDVTYEDGPHDAESLAYDAGENVVCILSKTRFHPRPKDDQLPRLYRVELPDFPPAPPESTAATRPSTRPEETAGPLVARYVGEVRYGVPTAMDFSRDGVHAAVRNYLGVFEFAREPGRTWAQALAGKAELVPAPLLHQGEAICYGLDGRTLYLTSEGRPCPLWELPAPASR